MIAQLLDSTTFFYQFFGNMRPICSELCWRFAGIFKTPVTLEATFFWSWNTNYKMNALVTFSVIKYLKLVCGGTCSLFSGGIFRELEELTDFFKNA